MAHRKPAHAPAYDDEFPRIREDALLSKVGHKNPSGTMILCAIDLAHLTAQRMVILFTRSKTKSSTVLASWCR